MVDLEQIRQLRAMGVKSIEIHKDGAHFVEFFEPAPSLVEPGRLEPDTLVPPPEEDGESPPPGIKVPPALAALIKRSSVS